jgi:hypothetical protein
MSASTDRSIYTVGHSTRPIEDFLGLLHFARVHGVRVTYPGQQELFDGT